MKHLIAVTALMLWACDTTDPGEAQDKSRNGTYQSTDKSVSLTIKFPNWEAVFLTRTPELHVKGVMVYSEDVTISNRVGQDSTSVTYSNYDCKVSDFFGMSAGGSPVKVDSSVLVAVKFSHRLPIDSQPEAYTGTMGFTDVVKVNDSLVTPAAPLNFIAKSFGRL